MNKLKVMLFVRRYLWWMYRPIKELYRHIRVYYYRKNQTHKLSELMQVADSARPHIFYLGITEHSNLGDLAQHYCIMKWIEENYPKCELMMFESSVVTDLRFCFIEKLKKVYRPCDIIIFQSGYCTQDLGGDHELMHRMVCDAIPDARILMMPQTIFFQHENNKLRTSQSYNQARNMLFLARDDVSFQMAKQMFPDVRTMAFPDIVTTLIGSLSFDENSRDGVCVCCRNDGEKLFPENEINKLISDLRSMKYCVNLKDTQGTDSYKVIRKKLWDYIYSEIESYSHYRVTITDRYHGTIFSLVAGTPVIIIPTNDHKVITGADWFKGVYDGYVYVANTLEEARQLACSVAEENMRGYKLKPYFKTKYYDKLSAIFENIQSDL